MSFFIAAWFGSRSALAWAQRRFGADVAEALSELIEGVDDAGRLTEVGDWVVDSATGGELLNRAGRA